MQGIYKNKFCPLKIVYDENFIYEINFCDEGKNSSEFTGIGLKATKQLEEYFAKKRTVFDLPLKISGTDFQKKVWDKLLKIPYGETMTYKDIASLIGKEKASRAVGGACNKNHFAIVIPCHRVIGSNKSLTGYAGGIDLKQSLLDFEKNN